MIKGTDLSHWNNQVDYDAMKDWGIRFGCLKLGQGKFPNKDDMFDKHVSNFDRLGIPWDLYWFCDYRYTALANVMNLIAKAGGNWGRGHPVCDLEYYDGFGARPDRTHMRAWALEFFREFEARTGLICMFYSNRDMINQIMAGISAADKAEFLRHDLWLATHAAFGNPSPWLKYRLNQYELDFVISWAHGTVDLNDFNGTEADFTAWSNSQVPPAPLALEEKVNILWREAGSHGWNLHP